MNEFGQGYSETERRESYVEFQNVLSGIHAILQNGKPERWWHQVYRYLRTQQKRIDRVSPALAEALAQPVEDVLALMRAQAQNGSAPSEYQTAAQDVIHKIADLLHEPERKRETSPSHTISFEELARRSSNVQFVELGGKNVLRVRVGAEGAWFEFSVPMTEDIMMKGGLPRILLKQIVGAPREIIATELPVNDIDVIATGDRIAIKAHAQALGADAEGIEWTHDIHDIEELFFGRDIDLNECFVTSRGLLYTDRAAEAASTGIIEALASDRGIYGNEELYYDKVRLMKNRALSRLVKFVAEGKALSFEMTPLNKNVPLGIYWLVLARKFSTKPNAPVLLDRLFEIGKQMGQVKEGETLFDVLDRAHAESPFFRLDDGPMGEEGVTKWLGTKLEKLADRAYRNAQGIKIDLRIPRTPDDTVPFVVSLNGHAMSSERIIETRDEWGRFLERCRHRSAQFANEKIHVAPKPLLRAA